MDKHKETFIAVAMVLLSVIAVAAFSNSSYVAAFVFALGAAALAFTD